MWKLLSMPILYMFLWAIAGIISYYSLTYMITTLSILAPLFCSFYCLETMSGNIRKQYNSSTITSAPKNTGAISTITKN